MLGDGGLQLPDHITESSPAERRQLVSRSFIRASSSRARCGATHSVAGTEEHVTAIEVERGGAGLGRRDGHRLRAAGRHRRVAHHGERVDVGRIDRRHA